MYIHFSYKDGSNPYISASNKNLFKMICKYILEQTSERGFDVLGEGVVWTCRPNKKISEYQKKRLFLQTFAQNWQENYHKFHYSWEDILFWGAFFEEYGKKYGLLREFRENGIV